MAEDRPRIETPGLEAFLAEGDECTPKRYTAREFALILRAIRDPIAEDGALQPHLRIVVWRLVRAIAAASGLLDEDELLSDALDGLEVDPWYGKVEPRPTPSQRALLRHGATSVLYEAASQGGGFPLLPPTDGRTQVWCDVVARVAEDIGVARAPRGADCLRVLLDPELAAATGLNSKAVLVVEDLMVDQALRVLVRHGEQAVIDHFQAQQGLSRREGHALITLARAAALRHGRSTVEDDRALMSAMLKDYLARARDSFNMGDEIRALRELARVQGLTRTEPEDREGSILDVIKRVGAKQDMLNLPASAVKVLPLDPPTDTPFRVTEERVLEAFDIDEAAR